MAECILCGSDAGVIVLDLGAQPSPRHWPLPTDPLPDPTHALALRLCPDCGLAQLDADDTTEPEVPVPEPQAVVDQARRAVADLGRLGHLDGRTSVVEFGSPHGGSWLPLLDLTPTDGPADLVVDSFGLMHERDLPAALARRAKALADDGLAAFLIQPLGDVVAQSAWTVLRHGHHGYFTLTSLRTALGTVGITPTSVLRYDLYGGVAVVLASRGGQPDADLLAAYDDESRRGLAIPEGLACLAEAVSASTGQLRISNDPSEAVYPRGNPNSASVPSGSDEPPRAIARILATAPGTFGSARRSSDGVNRIFVNHAPIPVPYPRAWALSAGRSER